MGQVCSSKDKPGQTGQSLAALETVPKLQAEVTRLQAEVDRLTNENKSYHTKEQHATWSEHGPPGSKLLQFQACALASGEEAVEFSLGCLFMAMECFMWAESDATAAGTPQSRVGPFTWDKIKEFTGKDGKEGAGEDLRLELEDGSVYHIASMADVGWLQRLGKLQLSAAPAVAQGATTQKMKKQVSIRAPEDAKATEAWMGREVKKIKSMGKTQSMGGDDMVKTRTRFWSAESETRSEEDAMLEAVGEGDESETAASPEGRSSQASAKIALSKAKSVHPERHVPITRSFQEVANAMPADATSSAGGAVFSAHMPKTTFAAVKSALQEDDHCVLFKYVEKQMKGWDIRGTAWMDAAKVPGTQVRRLQFRMKLPADVPAAVKKIVKVPDDSAVIILARMGATDNKIMIVIEIQTPDAPFGGNFWASEVLTFTPHKEVGVNFDKFAHTRWIQKLPWYASMVGPIVEDSVKKGAAESGATLSQMLQESS